MRFPALSPPLFRDTGLQNDLAEFHLHPHYRVQRPVDATLLKVEAGSDQFITEKYADELAAILQRWTAGLVHSPSDTGAIQDNLAASFSGSSLRPAGSRVIRNAPPMEVRENKFGGELHLEREAFLRELQSWLGLFLKIETAEFQITWIGLNGNVPTDFALHLDTRVRYEIVGSGGGFHREQRIGNWQIDWERASATSEFRVTKWRTLDETEARSVSPVYVDMTAAALGGNLSYSAQMLHGADYWRTVLDGSCGMDVYAHNGVSVADIDNDGFDDLYVCQTAGLPNRLYRNRGDGTFEDITETSGLGLLEDTACALFADFNNDGLQDAILVRTNGPVLFVNEGGGKFRPQPDAFRFASPPQGTFTGAAVADYDRDGWLDIYFCLYTYYQGTGQYRYPSPYHAAENGPPNFLMRNHRDGTFHDVTAESGLNKHNKRYSFCCGWGDYNRDGWPDLYVVNDFGRKNLYRNNGDGTFTDVAAEAGVEDVGAGMSVCWFDHNNDGADDLYVANMWTAPGVRVSMLDDFKKESSPSVRALYQKHAMGNSLLRNHGGKFAEDTNTSGTGIGRWAWSSDAIDFDHDGFPDLYIVNGFVSGTSRHELNSFFWRQVVANSPDEAVPDKNYELGWNAVNEMIRSDGTWSGYERNVFYANNRDGTFSDISGVAGLDFIEDGRAFALADFDHDGRIEIVVKNRNAPQLRALRNVVGDLPPSISFRLQGTKSNRDAIGASITVDRGELRQTRMLQAGSAFLSQHSKEVFFGLGSAKGKVRVSIRWPSGLVQELHDLPINHRIWVEEGKPPSLVEPFGRGATRESSAQASGDTLPSEVETWLLAPIPAPDFSLADLSGQVRSLYALRGKTVALYFWTANSAVCQADLRRFEKNYSRWPAEGLHLLAMNVDRSLAGDSNRDRLTLETFAGEHRFSFPIIPASEDIVAVYNIVYRQMFDRHRDLGLPTTFLIRGDGYIVKVYQGAIDFSHLEQDFRDIPATDEERLARGLPFPSSKFALAFGRNHLASGSLYFQRGYLEQAEVSFQQALKDDPQSAEALYGIGSVYLNQNKNTAAREIFERCVKLDATYPETLPDAWNNLGVLDTRDGHIAAAMDNFQQALKLNPRHLLSLDNLGNAYRLQKRWDEARRVLERALEVSPDDPEANYSLGMVFAQTDDTAKAYEHLQRALKSRPVYPEALNNLGILYLLTHRRDEAVASFEQSIRVAPAFDQAYLNLARVYALEGSRDKARDVLSDLLKQHPEHSMAKEMLQKLQ